MAKFRDVKPNSRSMYWCNTGNKCVIAQLLNEEIELFMLWCTSKLDDSWTAAQNKPGWYFKEEFAENLNFFQFP